MSISLNCPCPFIGRQFTKFKSAFRESYKYRSSAVPSDWAFGCNLKQSELERLIDVFICNGCGNHMPLVLNATPEIAWPTFLPTLARDQIQSNLFGELFQVIEPCIPLPGVLVRIITKLATPDPDSFPVGPGPHDAPKSNGFSCLGPFTEYPHPARHANISTEHHSGCSIGPLGWAQLDPSSACSTHFSARILMRDECNDHDQFCRNWKCWRELGYVTNGGIRGQPTISSSLRYIRNAPAKAMDGV